jgi:DNA-binding transcriptional MerR regulator
LTREEQLFSIGELAERAGVTPRTIRYYTAEGLLPRPEARGQYALYGEEHLLRLRLIARLKEAYLPLGEIKARTENLDLDQLRELLREPADLPASSAADYVAQILSRPPPQFLAESSAHYAPERPESPAGFQMPAAMLPGGSPPPVPPAVRPPAQSYGFAASAPVPPDEMLAASAGPAGSGGLLRKLIARGRERDAAGDGEERWRRVTLAPGVELHVREPAAPAIRERLDRLLALARELFPDD